MPAEAAPAAEPDATPAPPATSATPVAATPPWAQLHWELLDPATARGAWPLPLAGALLGGSLLLAGRYLRPRRAPSSRFETGVEVAEGFAQAAGGDEASYEQPLVALAEQVLDAARQRGCSSLRLRGAAAGRTRATLLLRVAGEEVGALETIAATFGARPDAVRLTTLPAGTLRWDQAWSTVRPRPVGATSRCKAPSEVLRLTTATCGHACTSRSDITPERAAAASTSLAYTCAIGSDLGQPQQHARQG